jgi:hypothetical protein
MTTQIEIITMATDLYEVMFNGVFFDAAETYEAAENIAAFASIL